MSKAALNNELNHQLSILKSLAEDSRKNSDSEPEEENTEDKPKANTYSHEGILRTIFFSILKLFGLYIHR